jgi:hypothetical protein
MFCVQHISFAHPAVSMATEQEELSCCLEAKTRRLRHNCCVMGAIQNEFNTSSGAFRKQGQRSASSSLV